MLHILFAWHQPFTNDEGAYLYDIKVLLSGSLPAGDVLTKTPGSVLVFAVGEYISHYSLFAARGMAVLVSMATAVPLFFIARSIATKRAGYYAVLFWLLGPGPIIFNTLGHTQVVASFFLACSLSLWIVGIRNKRQFFWLLVWSGVSFGLAFATRKIAIALVAPYVVSLFLYRSKKLFVSYILRSWAVGAGALCVVWIIGIYLAYGSGGVWHMVGGGYGSIAAQHMLQPSSVVSWGGTSERFFLTIIRAGAIYAIGIGVFLGIVGTTISAKAGQAYGRVTWGIVALIACGISSIAFHDSIALGMLWGVAAGYFFWLTFRPPHISVPASLYSVPASYLGGLVVLYACWPVLLAEYIGDFLVPATLLCAFVVASYASHVKMTALMLAVASLGSVISMHYTYKHSWTGMFLREAIYSAAQTMTQVIPLRDSVFTAAVIIPYVSGHAVPFHIAHPQWYRYEFILEKDRDIFLPPLSVLQSEVSRSVHWKIEEQLTEYSYGKKVEENWALEYTIPNNTVYRDNPIRVYSKVAGEGKSR